VPTTILRLTAVIGPGGKGGGRSWFEFARMMKEGRKIQIPHFSEEEVCHYVDIRDAARMHIVAGENPKAIGEVFNCCSEKAVSGKEFEEIVKGIMPEIEVEFGFPWSMAQGNEIEFSMEKAKKVLGFEPVFSLEDSIKSIYNWVKNGGLDSKEIEQKDKKFETGITSN